MSLHYRMTYVFYIDSQSTWSVGITITICNVHMHTKYGHGYGVWVYMECGNTTLCIINTDTDRAMDMKYGYLHGGWRHFTFLNKILYGH